MPTTYAIPDGRTVFAATTYTGNGSSILSVSNDVSGVSFKPDLVWHKIRSGTTQGTGVFDSNRGTTGQALDTTATTTEGTWVGSNASDYGYVSSFDNNGFTVNDGAVATTGGYVNYSARTYVAWQWKAGGTAVSNTSGTITSSVNANQTAGFSIVTYTGTGVGATVGHGLGVTPSFLIFKNRSSTDGWIIFTQGYTASTWWDSRFLFTTAAVGTGAGYLTSAPTSTLLTLGTGSPVNANGNNYVVYCWAAVPGFSAFGSYTGNGSSDGPFVYTGFRPRFILFKRTDTIADWRIEDTSRSPTNATQIEIYPNLSNAEGSAPDGMDILSNGFKLRGTYSQWNASGGTYIYAAFAETPFKYANAR